MPNRSDYDFDVISGPSTPPAPAPAMLARPRPADAPSGQPRPAADTATEAGKD